MERVQARREDKARGKRGGEGRVGEGDLERGVDLAEEGGRGEVLHVHGKRRQLRAEVLEEEHTEAALRKFALDGGLHRRNEVEGMRCAGHPARASCSLVRAGWMAVMTRVGGASAEIVRGLQHKGRARAAAAASGAESAQTGSDYWVRRRAPAGGAWWVGSLGRRRHASCLGP